ncbi:MAG: phospholipase D-like domain-containing protein [Sphaerochaetaceae bacterium]
MERESFSRRTLVLIVFTVVFLLSSCSTTSYLNKLYLEQKSVSEMMDDAGIPSFEATLPVFYDTGAKWNAHSLELIQQANDYILISTFLGVENPHVFPVWKALADKVKQGVRVYVIIDSSSNFQMVPIVNERIKAAYMQLHELGIEFVEYNSLSTSNLFFLPNMLDRDHRKYWVVDGEILALGGVNVNHTSIAWPEGVGNIDTMIEFVSPGATQFVINTFVDTWNNYSVDTLKTESFSVKGFDESTSERTFLWIFDHRWPKHSVVSDLFDLFSVYANEELWMVQGYTFLTNSLLERIQFATNRGVKVNIILSEYSTQPKYEMASRYRIVDLIKAGATVYMYKSPDEAFLHAKMIVADNTLVTIGSANYNFRSQTLSRELNVLYEDKRIANTVTTYIQELLQECRVITLEEAESYRDIRSWFNHLLMQVWG